ncbi:MAG: TolC family outer membrane protein [Rhodocyclaceae bacterium]|nr:TolC family outer membrane protein [Rhodocyclaceae bacterium]
MKSLLLASLIGLSMPAAWGMDLLEVYREALANDAQFAAARAQAEAGRETAVQGRAGLLPNIGLSANTTYNQNTFSGQDRNYNSNGYGAQLTQPVFRWQNWVQYQQGQLQVGISEAQLAAARQDLALRVAQAYFDVLKAADVLAAVDTLKTAASEQLALSKKSFEVGTVTITDVHEAQSRFDLANAQQLAAANDLEVKRQTLTQLIGRPAGALAPLRDGVRIERPAPADIDSWVGSAEGSAYGVQIQQLAAEIAAREVERNRAAHLPTVDLVARYNKSSTGFSSTTGSSADSTTRSIGLELAVPLFAGGALASRDREAVALKMQAEADLESARRVAALAARQAYLGVTSGMAQIGALEAAQVSSASALEANRLGYEVGVRINIDVLNAQSQLSDTEQQLAAARYDTLVAQLQLEAAAGQLDEDDIQRVNGLLAH